MAEANRAPEDQPLSELELDTDHSEQPKLEISGSRQLTSWMAEQQISMAFTTYQTGKVFFIGLQPDGRMSIFERTFNRCMGLWASTQTVYMTSLYQLWRFENTLPEGQLYNGYDKVYVPQTAFTTGDIDIHDLSVDANGRPVFINTLFSCIATCSETHSFVPLWKPNFISKLAAEDRCHLNGLAMLNGKPKYVTALSETDVHEAWREHRVDGGIVIDVDSNEIILRGLSMPHSIRCYQDKVWLLNSGTGEFGYIEFSEKENKFVPLTFCPGYARGLAFVNDYAIVGLSKPRENKTFTGLALDQSLEDKKIEARCGILIIDIRNGDIVHSLNIEGIVEELYDVAIIPNVMRPMALGLISDEIRRTITIGEEPN